MNKRTKKVLLFLLFITLLCGILLVTKNVFFNNEKKYNISELPEEFIDKYFEDLKNSNTDEEKDNMLIVISKNKIEDSYGATKIIESPNNQYILQYKSKEEKELAYKNLKSDKRIDSVSENNEYSLSSDNYNSWGIETMALDQASSVANLNSKNLQKVTVAIIDTGCDMTLFNKYYNGKIEEFYDVLENSTTAMSDEHGHGTHIAGTIAEGTPDNVKIFPVKVQRVKDYGTDFPMPYSIRESDIIAAVNYVVYYKKAQVINISLAGSTFDEVLDQAIEAAKEEKIIVVAAAGNENTSNPSYPAASDNTISVSAIDSNLQRFNRSNYGDKITFTAPGVNIKSIMDKNTYISWSEGYYGNPDYDDEFETISGTSMAAPHVASAVAIIKGYNLDLTLENVIDLLKEHTIDLGDEGWDQYFGYGLISFDNVEFCDGTSCDQYGVFKVEESPVTINKYPVDETNNYISKIMVNTESNTFTSNFTLGYGYGIDVDTKTVDDKQLLYTGGKTRITHGLDLYKEYTNIVIGDINGDALVNSADLLKVRQHLLNSITLEGIYFLASDVNYDNIINSGDLLRVRQHLLKSNPIE